MAAPNACGGITLLLSALLARGAKWSPRRIRMAIEATAVATPNATGATIDRWALGRGLLDVPAAMAWLMAHKDEPLADVRFVVTAATCGNGAASGTGVGRGLYLREAQHTRAPEVVSSAFIKPGLHEDETNTARVALDVTATLTPSAAWVSCAPTLPLVHEGKGFDVKVSLAGLPPGCHQAEVRPTTRPSR